MVRDFAVPSNIPAGAIGDGQARNNLSVALNIAGTDDNIADGSIVIRGQPENAFAIRDVAIRSTDFNNMKPSPNFFNTNMNITTLRNATGGWLWEAKSSGASSFLETPESGKPMVMAGLPHSTGFIKPGALEYVTDADFNLVCEAYPNCRVELDK